MKQPTIRVYGHVLGIRCEHYNNGRPALVLTDHEGIFAVVSVNIPEIALGPEEFLMKFYSENAAFEEPLRATGLFEDTGKRVSSGYVAIPIWQLSEEGRRHVRIS